VRPAERSGFISGDNDDYGRGQIKPVQ